MSHTRSSDCKECCCGGPTKCEETDCKGNVHRSVVDEIEIAEYDWEWVHDYKCDTCGYENKYESDGDNSVKFDGEL